MLHSHPPNLGHLRTFGCLAYASNPSVTDKISPRTILAALMGYSSTQKVLEPSPDQPKLFPNTTPDNISITPPTQEELDREIPPPPIPSIVVYHSICPTAPDNMVALNSYSSIVDPSSYKEVAADPKWTEAMKLEITTLEENKTWSIVDLLKGKTPIGCKWVFKVKYKSSGEVERYKAR
uniref:Uncharacterized protein LOC104211795 n=1 Tax=Nicotiana sylvestris TaxID=4096 RepID=A0A1U7UYH9_NICSY|nr:PREDICTED: uncharacterized protein LOC104211795 [Nicotiana sylvestris]